MRPVATFTLVLALVVAMPFASAQDSDAFKKCGDPELTLVFLNPDLGPREDGYVHVSGTFFIQFQARGEGALSIDSLKFSEGVEAGGVSNCDGPEWVTEGMALKNFRADYDPDDGFFIPINTCNVPNGTYVAAISVYDVDLKELVRYWTKAKVDNGPGTTKAEKCAYPDTTAPWPMILPGDGVRTDGGHGLYIEVAEALSDIEVFVNGVRIEVKEGLGPERDDDMLVDLGYTPALRDSGLTQAQVEKRQYPTYTSDRSILDGDVIKVRAVDLWGNVAEKIVHVGDPTIGGRATLTVPDFDLQVPEVDKSADANGSARYDVRYVTRSAEGLHADLYVRNESGGAVLPPGISYRLTPNHVMMGGNEDLSGSIELIASPEVKVGVHKLLFAASYLTGVAREEKIVPLTFRVDVAPQNDTSRSEAVGGDVIIPQETVRDGSLDGEGGPVVAATSENKTPMPLPYLAVVVACVLLARRRR